MKQTGAASYRLDDGTRVHAERLASAPDAGAAEVVGPTARYSGADADDSSSSDRDSVAESVTTDAGGGDCGGSDYPGDSGARDTEDVEARGQAVASDGGETGAAAPVRSGGASGARTGATTTAVRRSRRVVNSPDRLGFLKRRGINVVY